MSTDIQTKVVWFPVLLLTNHMTLGKLLNFYMYQFLCLWHENSITFLVGLLWRINEVRLLQKLARCTAHSKYSINAIIIKCTSIFPLSRFNLFSLICKALETTAFLWLVFESRISFTCPTQFVSLIALRSLSSLIDASWCYTMSLLSIFTEVI